MEARAQDARVIREPRRRKLAPPKMEAARVSRTVYKAEGCLLIYVCVCVCVCMIDAPRAYYIYMREVLSALVYVHARLRELDEWT